MEIFNIKNLKFRYTGAENNALDGINLSINEGDFLLLCGASGSGKTTLLKCLDEALMPSGKISGSIIYNNGKKPANGEIAAVGQRPEEQIITDKVFHELAFGGENAGLSNSSIALRLGETAAYFGLDNLLDAKTNTLSGGQKQLLNLASAMITHPSVLLLDEPTSQLDPVAAGNFISTVARLNCELGLTVIIAEHRLESLLPCVNRTVLMENGKIIFDGLPDDAVNAAAKTAVFGGLPAAARLFALTCGNGKSPVSIPQGREYLREITLKPKENKQEKITASKSETALKLEKIRFRYSRNSDDIINGVTACFEKEKITCILGANAAGKSTLMMLSAGLLPCVSGRVKLFGKDISKFRGDGLYHQNIAFLPQNPHDVFFKDTVGQDIESMKNHFSSENDFNSALKELSDMLGINEKTFERPAEDLSGGECQKAALLKVLLTQPKILFCDEPTKGLDPECREKLRNTLIKLKNDRLTVIMVTHDVEFAAVCANKCAMLFDGQLTEPCEPHEFFTNNYFYTTAAFRLSSGILNGCITVGEIAERINGIN